MLHPLKEVLPPFNKETGIGFELLGGIRPEIPAHLLFIETFG